MLENLENLENLKFKKFSLLAFVLKLSYLSQVSCAIHSEQTRLHLWFIILNIITREFFKKNMKFNV